MLGKTHLTVGVAASLTILQPESLPELVVGISAAAIGALISDIDIDSTQAHRNANLITAGTVMAIAAVSAFINAIALKYSDSKKIKITSNVTFGVAMGFFLILMLLASTVARGY